MTTVTISLASSDHEKPCKNAVKCSQGWEIEINSLDDLLTISKETGCGLIISPDLDVGYMFLSPTSVVTIYDTYVE